jgi:hypothetical protein
MKIQTAGCLIVLLVVASAAGFGEQGSHGSLITGTPEWEKIKSLVGEWDGYMVEGSNKIEGHISVRLTGDGSALMHWMNAGKPHEMITMFHMDKTELLATHYCAAHNQPRMRAVPSNDPKKVTFEFKDGTNIRPGDLFMRQLTIIFADADHHTEIWGSDNKGKIESATFYLTRSKAPAKK